MEFSFLKINLPSCAQLPAGSLQPSLDQWRWQRVGRDRTRGGKFFAQPQKEPLRNYCSIMTFESSQTGLNDTLPPQSLYTPVEFWFPLQLCPKIVAGFPIWNFMLLALATGNSLQLNARSEIYEINDKARIREFAHSLSLLCRQRSSSLPVGSTATTLQSHVTFSS